MAGFAATALLLFGIQVLINWRDEWLDPYFRVRVLNYIRGGILIFVMLTVANDIEVFLSPTQRAGASLRATMGSERTLRGLSVH